MLSTVDAKAEAMYLLGSGYYANICLFLQHDVLIFKKSVNIAILVNNYKQRHISVVQACHNMLQYAVKLLYSRMG